MAFVHAGRLVARTLKNEGVSHLFTLCGGHIQSIYDGCIDEGIRVIDVRHEQTAGHAAEGWARATGQIGVAAVTAGPGVTDAVTAVANAQRSQVPMLLIGGQGPKGFSDMGSLQEMDHVGLMRTITKWSATVPDSRRIPDYVTMAIRKARTGVPGPVFLEMPLDTLMDYLDDESVQFPTQYLSTAATGGDPGEVERAAALLAQAQRPVAVVGSQLFWSRHREAFHRFRDTFDVPSFVNGMARGALPRGDRNAFKLCRSKALAQADVVIVFGTPLDFRMGYARPPKVAEDARFIQVDLDPQELGRNRPCEVGLVGDSGLVMAQLAEAGARHTRSDRSTWREKLLAWEKKELATIAAEAASDASPVNPLRLCKDLADALDDRAVIVGDGGDIVGTGAKILDVGAMGQWMDPGPLGTLGVGPGYAMAAKAADPSRDVVILYGDGSFGLHGLEFEAMARQGLGIVGVIGNDAGWTQILRGQRAIYGEERVVATKLAYTRYELVAELAGGRGFWVEDAAGVRPAIDEALRYARESQRPAIVNVKIGGSDFRKDAISV